MIISIYVMLFLFILIAMYSILTYGTAYIVFFLFIWSAMYIISLKKIPLWKEVKILDIFLLAIPSLFVWLGLYIIIEKVLPNRLGDIDMSSGADWLPIVFGSFFICIVVGSFLEKGCLNTFVDFIAKMRNKG